METHGQKRRTIIQYGKNHSQRQGTFPNDPSLPVWPGHLLGLPTGQDRTWGELRLQQTFCLTTTRPSSTDSCTHHLPPRPSCPCTPRWTPWWTSPPAPSGPSSSPSSLRPRYQTGCKQRQLILQVILTERDCVEDWAKSYQDMLVYFREKIRPWWIVHVHYQTKQGSTDGNRSSLF